MNWDIYRIAKHEDHSQKAPMGLRETLFQQQDSHSVKNSCEVDWWAKVHQDEGTSYNQLRRRHNLFSIVRMHNNILLAISPLNGACIGVVVMQLATAEGWSMPTQPWMYYNLVTMNQGSNELRPTWKKSVLYNKAFQSLAPLAGTSIYEPPNFSSYLLKGFQRTPIQPTLKEKV
jgi:hypothetical protein